MKQVIICTNCKVKIVLEDAVKVGVDIYHYKVVSAKIRCPNCGRDNKYNANIIKKKEKVRVIWKKHYTNK